MLKSTPRACDVFNVPKLLDKAFKLCRPIQNNINIRTHQHGIKTKMSDIPTNNIRFVREVKEVKGYHFTTM